MWESMSPPFFSEACLKKDRLSFLYERRSSAKASDRRLFLESPLQKCEGLFLFIIVLKEN